MPCGLGEFSSGAASKCTQCAPGQFNDKPGASTCLPCAPGHEQPQMGQSTCIKCGKGNHTDTPGSASCKQCPINQVPDSQSKVCVKCPTGMYANLGFAECASCPELPPNSYYRPKAIPDSGPIQNAQAYACQYVCEPGTIGVSGCYTPFEFAWRQGGQWQGMALVTGAAFLTVVVGWIVASPSTGGICNRKFARACAVICGGVSQSLCCCGCCCGCFGLCPAFSRYMPARCCRCQAGFCSCSKKQAPRGAQNQRPSNDEPSDGDNKQDSEPFDCNGLLCICADPNPVSSKELFATGEDALWSELRRQNHYQDLVAQSTMRRGGAAGSIAEYQPVGPAGMSVAGLS